MIIIMIIKQRHTVSESTAMSFNGDSARVVHKVNCINKQVVLLWTCAVRVVNLETGKVALVYTQHDTASQATLISKNLYEELRLKQKC